jgi:hypothetical protein
MLNEGHVKNFQQGTRKKNLMRTNTYKLLAKAEAKNWGS